MVWEGISLDTDLLRGSPSPLTIRPCDGALVSEFLLLRDIAQSDAASVLDDKDINATGVSPESNPSTQVSTVQELTEALIQVSQNTIHVLTRFIVC